MLLDVKQLSVTFKVNGQLQPILKDLSFSLASQQTLGIVGESGSGKSVTALALLRLIQSPPLARMTGSIQYQGIELCTARNQTLQNIRGKKIGFIFQEPMTALNPVFTIGNQIMEMMTVHEGASCQVAKKRSIALLEEVGMPSPSERMHCYPHELSGGMRQRAMIAMALACGPEILIADEPTTALDVTIQAQILTLFKRLQQTHQMSIIFITHDLGVIAELADQVLVMQQGQIVEQGTINTIFHQPTHPYTQNLLRLLPQGSTDVANG